MIYSSWLYKTKWSWLPYLNEIKNKNAVKWKLPGYPWCPDQAWSFKVRKHLEESSFSFNRSSLRPRRAERFAMVTKENRTKARISLPAASALVPLGLCALTCVESVITPTGVLVFCKGRTQMLSLVYYGRTRTILCSVCECVHAHVSSLFVSLGCQTLNPTLLLFSFS